jgi:hypothetical protein
MRRAESSSRGTARLAVMRQPPRGLLARTEASPAGIAPADVPSAFAATSIPAPPFVSSSAQ